MRTRLPALILAALLPLATLAATPAPKAAFRIGNSGPSAGPNAASMLELLEGARLCFDAVNAEGGIRGRAIELLQLDDNFEVPRTVQNVQRLVDVEKVDALLLVRGTPHNEAILPALERAGVPLIGPSTGAMVLHKPVKRYVFNVRTAYRAEAIKLAHLLAAIGKSRVVVVHVGDSFGEDVMQGVVAGLDERGLKPVGVHKFDRKAVDIGRLVPAVRKADPDAIVLIGAGQAVASGIAALRSQGVEAAVATVSNNASSGFIKSLGAHAGGVMVSQVFPDERLGDVPLTREAARLARRRQVQLTPAMMEGYAAAKVAVEALRRCRGACTREDLHRSLESLDVDLGGMRLAYSATDHSGIDFTDLSIIDRNGRFRR